MLSFQNPGEIDIRAVTTFGVNVKLSDSPIGYFGTGLKYAIAVVLRLGGEITIHTGMHRHRFFSNAESIRGKEFAMVYMTSERAPRKMPETDDEWIEAAPTQALAFTLELGKNWEPWMAYRELYSNTLDESGTVHEGEMPLPAAGYTMIAVDCPALDAVHAQRHFYFLDPSRKPFYSHGGVEFYYGTANSIFYRGIAIEQLQRPALYTYNFTKRVDLTEDRVAKYPWMLQSEIANATAALTDATVLERIVQASDNFYERKLDYSSVYSRPGEAFLAVGARAVRARQVQSMPESALELIFKYLPELGAPDEAHPTEAQLARIGEALARLRAAGIIVQHKVCLAPNLDAGVLGCIHGRQIFVSARHVDLAPLRELTATILEEEIHLRSGARDNSREMQEALLSVLMDVVERNSAQGA